MVSWARARARVRSKSRRVPARTRRQGRNGWGSRRDAATLKGMQTRTLGRTTREVSVIGLGTWQLGGDWGDVSEQAAFAVLDASAQAGVTFFDTADVYGDGRSEKTIGQWRKSNQDAPLTVGTKMGRREAQDPENYSRKNFIAW